VLSDYITNEHLEQNQGNIGYWTIEITTDRASKENWQKSNEVIFWGCLAIGSVEIVAYKLSHAVGFLFNQGKT